jgi:hypothetical protein
VPSHLGQLSADDVSRAKDGRHSEHLPALAPCTAAIMETTGWPVGPVSEHRIDDLLECSPSRTPPELRAVSTISLAEMLERS